MWIRILDGASTIGGNKILVSDERRNLMLDFGLNFQVSSMYFRDFMSMRASRGLNDPLEMGLLPKMRIYREDLKTSDVNMRGFEKIKIDAVLITHAHMDHYGMVGYLDGNIPIVASPETLAIIKAYQDTSSDVGTQAIYFKKRHKPKDSEKGRILSGPGNISKEEKIRENLGFRRVLGTEKLSEKMIEFLTTLSGDPWSKIAREKASFGTLDDLEARVRSYLVDHSIYGATAYVVEGDATVAYTGDIRLHGERGELSERFAKEARDSSILIIEGTRLSKEEHEEISEREVMENSLQAIEDLSGKMVIVDFSSRNFERLKEFVEIARKTGRRMVITEKDAYAINALLKAGTKIDTSNLFVYKKLKEKTYWWNKLILNDPLWGERLVDPNDIRDSPGDYILAFSLYDLTALMDIKVRGGAYLYSSTEPFNEEMALDVNTLMNWLDKYALEAIGIRVEGGKIAYDHRFHASGHASPEDIARIIETIDPEIVIPVHTEHPEEMDKLSPAPLKILRNCEKFEI